MSRLGDWIETYTGKQFYPLDPKPEDVDITDIAHALSMLCRFNGHCKYFYSVAQHSINVMKYLQNIGENEKIQLFGLLHDASEAYISDVSRPVKPYLGNYKEIENNLQSVIWKSFGLYTPNDIEYKVVKYADTVMLNYEASSLMNNNNGWVNEQNTLNEYDIEPHPFEFIKDEFLNYYYELSLKIMLKS